MKPPIYLLIAAVVLIVVAPPAQALRLSRIEFDLSLPPGARETFSFHVFNDEAEETTVSLSLADWDRTLDGENRFFEPGTNARSASDWITFAPNQFTLAPDETAEVRFTLNVPPDVRGTHWAALLVEGSPREVDTQGGTTILVRRRFAVKILQTPPDTGAQDIRLLGLDVAGLNPLTVHLRVRNAGTRNLAAVKGRLELRDQTGTLESVPIEDFPMLPGAERRVTVASKRFRNEPFPAGRFLVLAILDFGGDDLLGGQLNLNVPAIQLAPLEPQLSLPQDLDRDGLFEDVNGDGQLTDDDPVLLGFHLDNPAVLDNHRLFDYDNDGDVDFDDVLALRARVETQSDA